MIEILQIEDNEGDIVLVKEVFDMLSTKVSLNVSRNGEEGLAYLKNIKTIKPNLILLDLNMPKVNGKEFLSLIKKEPNLKRIPVIILTTSDNPKDVQDCYDLNVSGYVKKALNFEDFFASIKKIEGYWLQLNTFPAN